MVEAVDEEYGWGASYEVWRCITCNLYFQNKTQAIEHEISNHQEHQK